MTHKKARQILGITENENMVSIKKRYHERMRQIHPDVNPNNQDAHMRTLEINEAYTFLLQSIRKEETQKERKEEQRKKNEAVLWDAPINPFAYAEREIYHEVEDANGNQLGVFVLTRGKYFWDSDIEDYRLFLLSIRKLCESIIEQHENKLQVQIYEKDKIKLQAELSYLLMQQFMDDRNLDSFTKVEMLEDGQKQYRVDAMLELSDSGLSRNAFLDGDFLYPLGMKNHRLYLKNKSGQKAGYLSFADDWLYYILIPLFEQKRVKVKIMVDGSKQASIKKKRITQKVKDNYVNLKMWLRLNEVPSTAVTQSLSEQIDRLLKMIVSSFS